MDQFLGSIPTAHTLGEAVMTALGGGREVGARWERGGSEVGARWERGFITSEVEGQWMSCELVKSFATVACFHTPSGSSRLAAIDLLRHHRGIL